MRAKHSAAYRRAAMRLRAASQVWAAFNRKHRAVLLASRKLRAKAWRARMVADNLRYEEKMSCVKCGGREFRVMPPVKGAKRRR